MGTAQEALIVRYLIGDLPPSDREQFESRLFSEPGLLDLVEVIEERLICDALSGELEPAQLERFHGYFLSFPDLRTKFEATKALRNALGPVEVRPLPPQALPETRFGRDIPKGPGIYSKRLAIAACVGALFFVLDDARRFVGAGRQAVISSMALDPGAARSATSQQVVIPITYSTALLRITLRVERSDRHNSYQAVLKQVDSGNETLRWSGLGSESNEKFRDVVVDLPATMLPEADFTIALYGARENGFEPVETYSFRVVRPHK